MLLAEEGDGVLEEGEALAVFGKVLPGPTGVVRVMEEGLGVGHEAEDPAGGVADAGDGVHGAVGIVGVGHGGGARGEINGRAARLGITDGGAYSGRCVNNTGGDRGCHGAVGL